MNLAILLLIATAAALGTFTGLAGVYDGRSLLALVLLGVAGLLKFISSRREQKEEQRNG